MDKIFTNNSWSKIREHLPKDSPKFAAVAYVSKGCPMKFGDGDILICDASASSIRNGNTDARTLMAFKKGGAKIYSCENLHAKAIVSGKFAIIGSSNLSQSSEEDLLEATLITDRRHVRAQVLGLINNLVRVSKQLKVEDINKLLELPVSRRFSHTKRKKVNVDDAGTTCWVVNVNGFDDKEEEARYVEEGEKKALEILGSDASEIESIRCTRNTTFEQQAKPGDLVLEIFINGRIIEVWEPRPILYRQDHKKWKRFYLELREDHKKLSWSKFKAESSKVGIKNITENSTKKLWPKDIVRIENVWEA